MTKSILSVNGHRAMNFLLQTLFEKKYGFVGVNNVFQAINYLKNSDSFKILFVDLDFQTQQGLELIEHIKSSRLYKIPIIVLLTSCDDSIKQKCFDCGVDEMFFKPFNPIDLIRSLEAISTERVTFNY